MIGVSELVDIEWIVCGLTELGDIMGLVLNTGVTAFSSSFGGVFNLVWNDGNDFDMSTGLAASNGDTLLGLISSLSLSNASLSLFCSGPGDVEVRFAWLSFISSSHGALCFSHSRSFGFLSLVSSSVEAFEFGEGISLAGS